MLIQSTVAIECRKSREPRNVQSWKAVEESKAKKVGSNESPSPTYDRFKNVPLFTAIQLSFEEYITKILKFLELTVHGWGGVVMQVASQFD